MTAPQQAEMAAAMDRIKKAFHRPDDDARDLE